MPLTRSFKELVRTRAQRDPGFRRELLREGAECLLAGDMQTGKAILRDYVNATIGFEGLAKATHMDSKSIMRMLGPEGNPQAANLFDILKHLQAHERVHLAVSTTRPAAAGKAVMQSGKYTVMEPLRDDAAGRNLEEIIRVRAYQLFEAKRSSTPLRPRRMSNRKGQAKPIN